MQADAVTPAGPVRWDKAGWVVVALNLVMAFMSTMYFLAQARVGVAGWLAMNSCAPSIFLFVLGYLCRSLPVMAVGAGLMFRYGTLGLFFFGWDGPNLIAQVGHIFMTVAVCYVLTLIVRRRARHELAVAVLVAVAMLYANWQNEWFNRHPQALAALFQGQVSAADVR